LPHGLAQSKAVTGENSPRVVSADSVRSGTCPEDPSGMRQEIKNHETQSREDDEPGDEQRQDKNYYLSGIHGPGTHEDCKNQAMGQTIQPQVQQTEQTTVSGYFRSRIPAHDPIKGEAG